VNLAAQNIGQGVSTIGEKSQNLLKKENLDYAL